MTPSLVLQICVIMILGFLWCLKLSLDLYVLPQISQEWRRQWHDLLRLDLACFYKTLLFHTPAEILCAVLKFVWHVGCWRFYNIHHISSFFSFFLSQRFLVTRLSRGLYHIPALANWRSTDFAHEYWTDFVSSAKSIQMFLSQPPLSLCCFFQPFAILLGTMAMHQLCTPSLQSSAPG